MGRRGRGIYTDIHRRAYRSECDLYNGFYGILDLIRSMTYFSNFFPFAFMFSLSVGATSNTFLLSGKPYRQIECRSSIL